MALPATAELLFGDRPDAPKLPAAEVSERFDNLLKAVSDAPTRTLTREEIVHNFKGGHRLDFTTQPTTAYGALTKAMSAPEITKGLSGDALASVTAALESLKATQPDLVKDLTLTSPVATGLVAFDLEAPKLSWAAA